MKAPSPWEATLLAAAAYRLWRLAAEDTISDRARDRITDGRPRLEEFVACPWCLGFWITVGTWAAWQTQPERTVAVAAPLALSAAVGATAHVLKA